MGKRLRELCSTLDISEELRLKIWTCFEFSLVHCTRLMVDRHLDQLLMCAIYIIAKVGFDRSETSQHFERSNEKCLSLRATVKSNTIHYFTKMCVCCSNMVKFNST